MRRYNPQLTDRDAHSIHPKIAKTQDALSIGEDDDLDVLRGVVVQDLLHVADVLRADVQSSRHLTVNMAPFSTRLSNRGSIDYRHGFLRMCREDAVKQRLVGILDIMQKQVFLQRSTLLTQLFHTNLNL